MKYLQIQVHSVVHVKNTTVSQSYTSFEDLFFGRPQQRQQIGTHNFDVVILEDLSNSSPQILD